MAAEESRQFQEDGRGYSFRSRNTDRGSEEVSALALQQYSGGMPSQAEFMESPCDNSGLSTSSVSLYTPDSDLDLFDRNFSTYLVQRDSESSNYDQKCPHIFQDGPQLLSSSAWISESKGFASTFLSTPMIEKGMWGSQTEIDPVNASPPPFENFNISSRTPLPVPRKTGAVRDCGQSINTAETRYSTHRHRQNTRPLSTTCERTSPSLKLRAAESPRPSPSPNPGHPKNLKRTHNMVEKQYRNRLNGHFASLLAKIPDDLAVPTGFEGSGAAKNISKAETLVLAERYIKMLQAEGRDLRKRNKRLEEDYDRLKKAWISSGGIMMP